jgi:spore maturation protein CgeB
VKVLVAGDFAHAIYEPELCWGLREAGADVVELPVLHLFGPGELLRRAQTRLVAGPGVALANAALVAACARHAPDAVLAFRAPWLHPLAIEAARGAGARAVVLYNNDDPFGPDRDKRIWRAFREAIPAADLCLAYRSINMHEYEEAGAARVALLRSWFSPRLHRPLPLTAGERALYGCDAIFIGHAEDDGRAALLEALLEAGLHLKLFGTGWDELAHGRPLAKLLPAPALRGDDYAKALSAAKVALAFLSARNRDQYTRRCFEIPACGALLLAPRTEELRALFREGDEALFFEGKDELVAQVRLASEGAELRARIAEAGRRRVLADGHDVVSRARQLLELLEALP